MFSNFKNNLYITFLVCLQLQQATKNSFFYTFNGVTYSTMHLFINILKILHDF